MEKASLGIHSQTNTLAPLILGVDERLEEKLENIVKDKIATSPICSPDKDCSAREEFLKVAKLLLFFAAFEPVITSSARLRKLVSKNLKNAGCAENIELWRCWTPNQFPLLKCGIKKLMFVSAPSTGKTILMTEEACFIAFETGKNL